MEKITQNIFNKDNIKFISDSVKDKNEMLKIISSYVEQDLHLVEQENIIYEKLHYRESEGTTGFGNGVALPHARVPNLKRPLLLLFKLKKELNWESLDAKNVNLIFCILVPEEQENDMHIAILGDLANIMMDDIKIEKLKKCWNKEEIIKIFFDNSVQNSSLDENQIEDTDKPYFLAVSACTFGLAHTYLVEKKLENYAHEHNFRIKVETHGAKGDLNIITEDDLKKAKGVIIAVDRDLDLSHIKHDNILRIKTSDVMKNVDKVFSDLQEGKKRNVVKQFIKLKLFTTLNSSSAKVFNLMMILGTIIGLSIYIVSFDSMKNNVFFNDLIKWSQYISVLAPSFLLGALVYITLNKNQVLTGSVFTGSAIITFKNFGDGTIGIMGTVAIFLMVFILSKILTYLNVSFLNFSKKKMKLVDGLIGENIYSGIKWLIKICVPIIMIIVLYYSYHDLSELNNKFYDWIFKMNKIWWFTSIIAFVFLCGMLWDMGGPINKWTLFISGILFYDSMAVDVHNMWMAPITATAIAIVAPVGAAWFRGLLSSKLMDEEEKKASIDAGKALLKSMTEGFIYFKEKYGYKTFIANGFMSLTIAVLIGYFNLHFFGGMNNPFGLIFSFSTSDVINIPNMVFGIITLDYLIVGGLIHLVCYPPKKGKENGKQKMKSTLHSANSLR